MFTPVFTRCRRSTAVPFSARRSVEPSKEVGPPAALLERRRGPLTSVGGLFGKRPMPISEHRPCYRLFLTFAASSVCASANVRTVAVANAASALGVGWVTDGFTGQSTRPAAGIESGRMSSTVSVSPER
jgi:hypothetical protein